MPYPKSFAYGGEAYEISSAVSQQSVTTTLFGRNCKERIFPCASSGITAGAIRWLSGATFAMPAPPLLQGDLSLCTPARELTNRRGKSYGDSNGWELLDESTVLVHGLAIDRDGVALLRERRASLIVCPSSNKFLFGRLPDASLLSRIEKVALGSDSPLTAEGDLLDEVRFAMRFLGISAISRLSNGDAQPLPRSSGSKMRKVPSESRAWQIWSRFETLAKIPQT